MTCFTNKGVIVLTQTEGRTHVCLFQVQIISRVLLIIKLIVRSIPYYLIFVKLEIKKKRTQATS